MQSILWTSPWHVSRITVWSTRVLSFESRYRFQVGVLADFPDFWIPFIKRFHKDLSYSVLHLKVPQGYSQQKCIVKTINIHKNKFTVKKVLHNITYDMSIF